MTIPIIPGPFSFLEKGAEAYFQEKQRREQERRANDVQNIALFTQLLPYLNTQAPAPLNVPGVATGGMIPGGFQVPSSAPETYRLPDNVQDSFQRITGGVPQLKKSPELLKSEAEAKVAGAKARVAGRMANADVKGAEGRAASDAAKGATDEVIAGMSIPELQAMNPAQVRQLIKVASPANAEMLEKVFYEKLVTEHDAQFPERNMNEMRRKVTEEFLKGMEITPELRSLAPWMAVPGGMEYIISKMRDRGDTNRMGIALNQARLEMLKTIFTNSVDIHQKQDADWDRQRSGAVEDAVLMSGEEEPEKQTEIRSKALQLFEKTHPRPELGPVLEGVLQQNGLTREEFQGGIRALSGQTGPIPQPKTLPPAAEAEIKALETQFQAAKARGGARFDERAARAQLDQMIKEVRRKHGQP